MSGYCGKDNGNDLLNEITSVSFALDDLRLYLDTHPDNAEALAMFGEYVEKRAALVGEYTEKYGSLDSYYPNLRDGWDWNAALMPWKKEANR